jgi:ribosomal protein S18 acetylase RimI-like enzyme
MAISYFKRYKMEIELAELPAVPPLPRDHHWVAWDDALLETHAEVKFQCFQDEIDATIFPSLGSREGCSRLMQEIRKKASFVPLATWLVAGPFGYCGTVQGIGERSFLGLIQNLGVTPAYRGQGIGMALLLQALHGFRRSGLSRGLLEVTSSNDAAIRLYRRAGFRCKKTVYKAVEMAAVPHLA